MSPPLPLFGVMLTLLLPPPPLSEGAGDNEMRVFGLLSTPVFEDLMEFSFAFHAPWIGGNLGHPKTLSAALTAKRVSAT